MAHMHATAGKPIDLDTFGEGVTTAVVKVPELEVIRLVAKAGKPIPPHQVDGPMTVHCLEGTCTFSVGDRPEQLVAGSWLYLDGGTVHSVASDETCVLLITIVLPRGKTV